VSGHQFVEVEFYRDKHYANIKKVGVHIEATLIDEVAVYQCKRCNLQDENVEG